MAPLPFINATMSYSTACKGRAMLIRLQVCSRSTDNCAGALLCFVTAGGYHPVAVGERFHGGKYVVLRKLGWGHFSTVWLVMDTSSGAYGAMKVRHVAHCCSPIAVI